MRGPWNAAPPSPVLAGSTTDAVRCSDFSPSGATQRQVTVAGQCRTYTDFPEHHVVTDRSIAPGLGATWRVRVSSDLAVATGGAFDAGLVEREEGGDDARDGE